MVMPVVMVVPVVVRMVAVVMNLKMPVVLVIVHR